MLSITNNSWIANNQDVLHFSNVNFPKMPVKRKMKILRHPRDRKSNWIHHERILGKSKQTCAGTAASMILLIIAVILPEMLAAAIRGLIEAIIRISSNCINGSGMIIKTNEKNSISLKSPYRKLSDAILTLVVIRGIYKLNISNTEP